MHIEEVTLLSGNAKTLLNIIPKDGTAVGNGKAQERCNFSLVDYDSAKTELITAGLIRTWKGRGGSVRLVNPTETAAANSATKVIEPEIDEVPTGPVIPLHNLLPGERFIVNGIGGRTGVLKFVNSSRARVILDAGSYRTVENPENPVKIDHAFLQDYAPGTEVRRLVPIEENAQA